MATSGSSVPKLSTWRFNQVLRKSETSAARSSQAAPLLGSALRRSMRWRSLDGAPSGSASDRILAGGFWAHRPEIVKKDAPTRSRRHARSAHLEGHVPAVVADDGIGSAVGRHLREAGEALHGSAA